jgi:3-phenylpropionate/trans-cinnamate dioxygenase ferredoxin reductase component
MNQSGIVIVGAGETGGRAALTLREAGYDGSITLIGEERHLPYERPPLSKAAMVSNEEPAPTCIMDEARCGERRIVHLARTRVTSIDRSTRQVRFEDGSVLPYDKLLLTTGARARRLSVPGAEHALVLRSFDEALALRRALKPGAKICVIGGGFIGLEIAASAIQRGCRVTVVEVAPRLLARGVPLEIAERVQKRHEREGVTIHLSAGVDRIEANGNTFRVSLTNGETVGCDAVIAGVGATPETTIAADAGLAIDNGIAVDDMFRTSDADVFAAGDCCSFPIPHYGGRRVRLESWRSAQDQGPAAARAMLGASEPYSALPWFWSDQYDETLQIAGLPDEGRTTVARDTGDATFFFHLADNGRLVAASAYGPNGAIARDIKVAEMLIAARATPRPSDLAAPDVKLKGLLRTR